MTEPNKDIRVLILGTGSMARVHAEEYAKLEGVKVVAGVDMREDALNAFCDTHGIEHRFTSLEAAIEWGEFDAASNATPDSAHYATTMSLLAAGKHVLCEKPLSTDYGHAREMADAAATAGVVNMINLSYRRVPALQKAAAMVAAGEIGTVRHFEACYLQSWLTQAAWGDWKTDPRWLWRLSTPHGSKGVLGDVGIHIIDFATFAANGTPAEISCRLKTFHKAEGDRIGDYLLDANDNFLMHLELEGGATGTITASRFASGHHNDLYLKIYGDKGALEVNFIKFESELRGCLGDDMLTETWKDIPTEPVADVYERFIDTIRGKGDMDPDFERGALLQHIIDSAYVSDADHCRSVDTSHLPPGTIETGEKLVFG